MPRKKYTKSIDGKLAVITGVGSGIGRATALALARQGARIAGCDIHEAGLETLRTELAQQGCDVVAARVDVGDRDSVAGFAKRVQEECGPPDVLINSAGVYLTGNALELSLEDWNWVLSANLWGVIHTCHYFLPAMVASGNGGSVLNVASMYGYWPSPCVAGYLTSKYAVVGYSEALREDLHGNGIRVSTVCPGIVDTGLVQAMRIRTAGSHDGELRASLKQRYAWRGYAPERVADAILRAIRNGKHLVLVSPESRVIYQVQRFAPWLSRLIARRAANHLFLFRE